MENPYTWYQKCGEYGRSVRVKEKHMKSVFFLLIYLTPCTKVNLKWIHDLQIRPKVVKLLEENI